MKNLSGNDTSHDVKGCVIKVSYMYSEIKSSNTI